MTSKEKVLTDVNKCSIMLSDKDLERIYTVLQSGDRVELIPLKDGIKAVKVERHRIK